MSVRQEPLDFEDLIDSSSNKQEVSRNVSSDNKRKDVKLNEELPKSLIAIKHLRNTLESPSFFYKSPQQTLK